MTSPKIAIVGAGPGGLMLASILYHNNIPCTVFERESSAVAREQGGTLDIHEHSGQRAIDAAGLLDKFRSLVRPGGESGKVMKKDGRMLLEVVDDGQGRKDIVQGRPEIDRPVLKGLLIGSLPVDAVHWGCKVTSIRPVPDSERWTIQLGDGSSTDFDLVVGADGAWSRTRALLTDTQPFYSSVTALDVCIHDVDNAAPKVSSFVGLGSAFIFAQDRAMLFQRNGEDRARCYACVRTPGLDTAPAAGDLLGMSKQGDESGDVDWTNPQNREAFVEKYFGDFFPAAKEALLAMTEQPVYRPLYMHPVGLTWETRPGLTILGDAAHLMTPFAGVGVNVALMDALELAQGIVGYVESGSVGSKALAAVLQRYEKGMFARSSKDAGDTEAAMNIQFKENGGEEMIRIMTGKTPEELEFK